MRRVERERRLEMVKGEKTYLAGEEVELGGVELVGRRVIRQADAKVAHLMYGRRPLREPLLLPDPAVLDRRLPTESAMMPSLRHTPTWPSSHQRGRARLETHVVVPQLREIGLLSLDAPLPEHEVERPPINRVLERNALAPAGRILQLTDPRGPRQRPARKLQIVQRLHHERRPHELVLGALLCAEHEGLGAVAAVVRLLPDLRRLVEAEVVVEGVGGGDVLVLVVDVGEAHEVDLSVCHCCGGARGESLLVLTKRSCCRFLGVGMLRGGVWRLGML